MSENNAVNVPMGNVLAALKQFLVEKSGSQRKIAKDFGILRSNFQRYIEHVKIEIRDVTTASDDDFLAVLESATSHGPTGVGFIRFFLNFLAINPIAFFQIFTRIQENALMEYILKCCNLYHGLSITEVKQLALQFATKLKVKYPAKWNEDGMAGRKWFDLFIRRHPNMTLRTPQQIWLFSNV